MSKEPEINATEIAPSPRLLPKLIDLSAWFSICLFVSGGIVFRHAYAGRPTTVELNQWGVFLLPALLLALSGRPEWRDLSFIKVGHRLWPHLGKPLVTVAIVTILPTLHLLALLSRHTSFQSQWDLSIYANACANGLQSSLRGHASILADHFEPFLLLLAPMCSAMNSVTVLLFTQCLAWTIGALGIRAVAKSENLSSSISNLLMALYLLFAGNQTISYYDFHTYSLSIGTIPWIWYAIRCRRYAILAVATVVHLSLKENTPLFVAGLGVLLLGIGRRRLGFGLLLTGLLYFVAVMVYVFPYFRHGLDSEYFAKYYGHIGSTFSEFITISVTKPWIPFKSLLEVEKIKYVLLTLAPFCFLHVLRPIYLLPVLGAYLIACLSNMNVMYSGNFHYEAEIYAWLFVSAIGLCENAIVKARIERIRKKLRLNLSTSLTAMGLWIGILVTCFSGVTPQGRIAYYAPSRPQLELNVALQTLSKSLKDCKVATVERVAPHLAKIPELTMLAEHSSADAIVMAYPQGDRLWMQDLDTIESKYVPEWNQNYRLIHPLPYDKDFRVWIREPCKFDDKAHLF